MEKLRRCAAAAILCIGSIYAGLYPTRMDIYDASDNHLLFVTFEYTGEGVCTGRNVYASDETFLYHTTVQNGVSGPVKENSVDYIDNPLFTSTFSASAGKTDFSTVDQFGLSQFGSALSHTQTEQNNYEIKQGNALLCKEKYEYDSLGMLSRIIILDKNGQNAWYANVNYKDVGVHKPLKANSLNSLKVSANRGSVTLRCKLSSEQFVSAELLTLAGRRVRFLVHNKIKTGNHVFVSSRQELPANGAYIVRVLTDNVPVLVQKVFIQK
ncbi:MAG TPA: hypothetical protein VHP36_09585 [Chitinispirillaceae bacterium]|nr:hypothetical protein [Chitinispirillaceae bacterium]